LDEKRKEERKKLVPTTTTIARAAEREKLNINIRSFLYWTYVKAKKSIEDRMLKNSK
jgi:hypothetical protein